MPRIDIPFTVSGQIITQPTDYKIAAGGKNYFYGVFDLCDTWKDVIDKRAIFTRGNDTITMEVNNISDSKCECKIPWEVIQKPGFFYIGIVGGDRLPTNIIQVEIIRGCIEEGREPLPPTPDWFSIIDKEVQEIWNAYNNGELKGENGDPGYTPQKGKDYFTPDDIKQIVKDVEKIVKEDLIVDDKLSDISTNPVQNKVVNAEFNKLNRTGALFTFDGKDYILMDDKIEKNGKKYYGILRAINFAQGSWNYGADGMYLKVLDTSNINYDRITVCKGINTDIQGYKEEHFGGFGEYLIDDTYQWQIGKNPDNNKPLIFKGSVTIPLFAQLSAISKIDKQSHNKYKRTITRSTLNYKGVLYVDFFDDAPVDRGILSYDATNNYYCFTNVHCTDWYLMSYVSEDFFKNIPINWNTMGSYAKYLIRRDFTPNDFVNIYNKGEIDIIFEAKEALNIANQALDTANRAIDGINSTNRFISEGLMPGINNAQFNASKALEQLSYIPMQKIYESVVTEETKVEELIISEEEIGNVKLDDIYIYIKIPKGVTLPSSAKDWNCYLNIKDAPYCLFYFTPASGTKHIVVRAERMGEGLWFTQRAYGGTTYNSNYQTSYMMTGVNYISKFVFGCKDLPVDSIITVCGRKVVE